MEKIRIKKIKTMPHVSHLPLSKRKVLCSYMTVFESIYGIELALAKYEKRDENKFLNLHQDLRAIVNRAKNCIDDDGKPLQKVVQHIINNFIEDSKVLLEKFPGELKTWIDDLYEKVQQLSCRQSSQICDGGYFDDEIISNCGHCLRQLLKIFEFTKRVTIEQYTQHSSLLKIGPLRKLVLSTDHMNMKPHQFAVGFNINGRTSLDRRDPDEISVIQLIFWPENFTPYCYTALPYVLFHECICHAFQNILTSDGKRIGSSNFHMFAEGWMDWVAFSIMRKMAKHRSCTRGEIAISHLHVEVAKRFHESRVDYTQYRLDNELRRESIYRAYGKNAAEWTCKFIEQSMKDKDEAWKKFLQLSYELNITSLGANELERFVTIIRDALEEPVHGVRPPSHFIKTAKVKQKLLNYIQDNDVKALFYSVIHQVTPTNSY